MSKEEAKQLFDSLEKMEDKDAFNYMLEKKELIQKLGIVIRIDNDDVTLCWIEDEDDDNNDEILTFSFSTFGYYLLNDIFNALGFDSDLV